MNVFYIIKLALQNRKKAKENNKYKQYLEDRKSIFIYKKCQSTNLEIEQSNEAPLISLEMGQFDDALPPKKVVISRSRKTYHNNPYLQEDALLKQDSSNSEKLPSQDQLGSQNNVFFQEDKLSSKI